MAEKRFLKFVYILFLTSVTTKLVASLKHPPEPYIQYQLGDHICTPHWGKTGLIALSTYKNAAFIVTSPLNFRTTSTWQSLCKYKIRAPKGEHLFAVIQKMNLRRNSTHCIDYVLFKRKDKLGGRRFCGQLNRRTGMYQVALGHYDSQVIVNTKSTADFSDFDIDGGEIETTLYMKYPPLPSEGEFDLTVVYTPYKDCDKIKEDPEEYTTQKVLATNYSICIWKGYVCDGYQNCVPEICDDENNCSVVGNGTGTKVTIGAVTTIVLCFIIFVMGVWICRKNKKLCWSSDCAGPSAHDSRFARAERDTTNPGNTSAPVAPMLEVPVVPPVSNKDLPPSYDSLFSDPPNPSAT